MSAIDDSHESGAPLSRYDSAVGGLSSSPPKEPTHRRKSSSVPGVYNINDLGVSWYCARKLAIVRRTNNICRSRKDRDPDCSGDAKTQLVRFDRSFMFSTTSWAITDLHLQRRINTSPSTIEDKDYLKKMLTTPPVKKIDLHFPLGLEVVARNLKGVTIKDACDAIYKQYKKKVGLWLAKWIICLTDDPRHQADDELDNPYLAGFEWDKEECWTRFIVHCKKAGAPPPSKKTKNKKKEGETEES